MHMSYTFLILYLITISLFPRYQLSVKLMRGVCRFSDTHTVYVNFAITRHITLAIDR